MDPLTIAALAREGLALAVKLTMQAVQAGGMTEDEAKQALADAQSNWADALQGWQDARKG